VYFRNEKIAFLVAAAVLIAGSWLANWDPSEDAAFLILMSTFASGALASTLLYERERRASRRKSLRDR
jgi:hypothetical protein